jgi:hypothetical protein
MVGYMYHSPVFPYIVKVGIIKKKKWTPLIERAMPESPSQARRKRAYTPSQLYPLAIAIPSRGYTRFVSICKPNESHGE